MDNRIGHDFFVNAVNIYFLLFHQIIIMKKNLLLAICVLLFVPIGLFAAFSSKGYTETTKEVTNEPAVGSIQEAMKEFKSLGKQERKERIKEVKKAVKQYKAEKKAGAEPTTNTLLLVILAILLPPLAVYLHQGEINSKFWISLILTLLFFIPGMIYSLIVVLGGA